MPATSARIETLSHDFSFELGVPILADDEAHVFVAKLDDCLADELKLLLSPDERERAERFVFPPDRNRFIVARGLLRKLLAAYLETSASALHFAYGDQGKPSLISPAKASIRFNLAHSHELAVFAFSRTREVGIDVEFTGRKVEYDAIARRFFSAQEVREMDKLPEEARNQAFFDCWTRKEAYIKARGGGLSIPLDEFNVSLAPGQPAVLLENYRDAEECSRWSMEALPLGQEYRGALVIEGQCSRLKVLSLRLASSLTPEGGESIC